jgi:hypothetical protein
MTPASPVVLLALFATAAPLPEDGAFRWKFEKGMTFYQEMTTEADQQMKVMGQNVAQKQKQTFTFRWDVLKQEGANWVLRQRCEGVKMAIDSGGNKSTYDSTQPGNANNPLADFFKELVGSEFTVTLDRNMRVTKVDGRKQWLQKLAAANPQMKPLLEQVFSEEAMKQMAESLLKQMAEPLFSALPPRPLEKGESWVQVHRTDMGPGGMYQMTYEYLFQDKGARYADFRIGNILTRYEPPKNPGGGGLPFTITQANLKSKRGGGHIRFDLEKRRVDQSEMELEIEGTMDLDIGGQNTTIELRQEQKTTTKVTDANPLKK